MTDTTTKPVGTRHVRDKARTPPEPGNEPDMARAGLIMDRGAFQEGLTPQGGPRRVNHSAPLDICAVNE